jgi:hypothetical protein
MAPVEMILILPCLFGLPCPLLTRAKADDCGEMMQAVRNSSQEPRQQNKKDKEYPYLRKKRRRFSILPIDPLSQKSYSAQGVAGALELSEFFGV